MDEMTGINPNPNNKRRVFSPEFKQRVIQESFGTHTSVAVVARRYDLNANLVFKWRYLHKKHANVVAHAIDDVRLLPVSICQDTVHQAPIVSTDDQRSIEIDIKSGRIFLPRHVDIEILRTLIDVIRQC